jgi:hypothetical protein
LQVIPDNNDQLYENLFRRSRVRWTIFARDRLRASAQIGEAWAIAGQIQAGNPTSWYNVWSSYADRLYELAVKSRDAGHRVSAQH